MLRLPSPFARNALLALLFPTALLGAACSARGVTYAQPDGGDDTSSKHVDDDDDDADDDDSEEPAVTPKAACAAYAKARCGAEAACSSFQFELKWGERSDCTKKLSAECVTNLSETGVRRTPEDVEACAESFASAECTDLFVDKLPSECLSKGSFADGEACAHDEQCKTGFCKKASFGACGTCEGRPRAGETCSDDADCESGLGCVDRRCAKRGAKGERCSTYAPCELGLVCDASTRSCVKGEPVGATCASLYDPNMVKGCDVLEGAVCDRYATVCVQATIAMPGESCRVTQVGKAIACGGGSVCDGYECVAPLAVGEACTVSGGVPCEYPATCENGECVVPSAKTCK